MSTEARVATFKTARTQVGMPTAVLLAIITAGSGFGVAWLNKPPPPVVSPLTPDQAAALQSLPKLAQDVAEIKGFVRWAEPQIGLLIVRTDGQRSAVPR